MDWDELLFETPVVGRDLELMLLVQGLALMRGPMGSLRRVGEDVRIRPEVFVRRWAGRAAEILVVSEDAVSLAVGLNTHRALLMPDRSVLIVGFGSEPICRLCAPGDNVLSSSLFGPVVSD